MDYLKITIPAGKYINSPWVLVELDESDGTIEGFSPYLSVVLNYEWDHVDQYESQEALFDDIQTIVHSY